MADNPKTVAITGASGYIGSLLLRHLQDRFPGRLVALDTRPLPEPIFNTIVRRHDVGQPFHDLLSQRRVTTLVHLAFEEAQRLNLDEIEHIRETNLRTLQMALNSCVSAQVNHVIYLSSHTVYGAHKDNPIPLTERAPLRPAQDSPLAYDKFLSEQILHSFAQRHTNMDVTVLRSCPVLGPGSRPVLSSIFSVPHPLGLSGYNPPFQFLHENDLVRVLTTIIQRGGGGVFNLSGDGVAFLREIAAALPDKMAFLPPALAYPAVSLGWHLGLQRKRTLSDLELLKYPLLLSTAKLKQATGFRHRYTSLETITAFANAVLS